MLCDKGAHPWDPGSADGGGPQNGFMPRFPHHSMSLGDVRRSVDAITEELRKEQDSREYLIRGTRDVVILCSQAIIAAHGGDLKGAGAKAAEAGKLLGTYRGRAGGDLERYLAVPEQELTEALCLIALAGGSPMPGRDKIGVSGTSYVLGLLDCIGELKRMVYDTIRHGRTAEAERIFAVMEDLYNMLYPLATYDKLLKEARRKLDVNRVLLEGTRSALTEEIRRADLIRAMGSG